MNISRNSLNLAALALACTLLLANLLSMGGSQAVTAAAGGAESRIYVICTGQTEQDGQSLLHCSTAKPGYTFDGTTVKNQHSQVPAGKVLRLTDMGAGPVSTQTSASDIALRILEAKVDSEGNRVNDPTITGPVCGYFYRLGAMAASEEHYSSPFCNIHAGHTVFVYSSGTTVTAAMHAYGYLEDES